MCSFVRGPPAKCTNSWLLRSNLCFCGPSYYWDIGIQENGSRSFRSIFLTRVVLRVIQVCSNISRCTISLLRHKTSFNTLNRGYQANPAGLSSPHQTPAHGKKSNLFSSYPAHLALVFPILSIFPSFYPPALPAISRSEVRCSPPHGFDARNLQLKLSKCAFHVCWRRVGATVGGTSEVWVPQKTNLITRKA